MADNLLDKASILLTPTAYNDGSMLSVKPENGDGDFTFSRSSAATRVNAQGLVENVQIISSELVSNGNFSQIGTEEVSNGNFSQEGSELVTNGDFATDSDWSVFDGWSIANGKASNDGTDGYLRQNFNTVNGRIYKVVFIVSDYVSGSARPRLMGGTSVNGDYVSSNGTYTQYITSNGNTNFRLQADDFIGSIDNVSVKEVGQDWSLGTGWSIGDGQAINTMSGVGNNLYQESVTSVGGNFKAVITTTISAGSVVVMLGGGSGGYNVIGEATTSGTFTYYGVSNGTDNRILLQTGNGTLVGSVSITNISVKEVGQDWTFGTGWSMEDRAFYNDSATNQLSQSISLTSGVKYKLTFDIELDTINQAYIWIGNSGGSVNYTGTNYVFYPTGSHTVYFTMPSSQTTLAFYGNQTGGAFYITNISVKEITDDTDLPRINYEGFSYQDSLGSEEVVNGDFSNGLTNWYVDDGTSWTNVNNTAFCDGNNGLIAQNIVSTQNKVYKVTFDSVATNSSGKELGVRIDGGTYSWNLYPTGTHTIYLTAGSSNTEGILFYALNGWTGSIDNVSVKEVIGQEVVPDSGCGSWLLEPQSTNLVTYSEDLSDSSWLKASSGTASIPSVTSNYSVSPDGTLNASRVVFDLNEGTTSSDFSQLQHNISSTSGLSHTSSVYMKSNNDNTYNLTFIPVSGSTTIVSVTPQWKRFDLSANLSSSNMRIRTRGSESSSDVTDISIWGAQLEQQSYATSYIPTNGATNTRLQDIADNSGNSTLINSTEGVLYAEIAALADDVLADQRSIQIEGLNGSSNNEIIIQYISGDLRFLVYGNSTLQLNTSQSVSLSSYTKVALLYKNNVFKIYINGTERYNVSGSYIMPTNLNKLNFSRSGVSNFYGKNKALAVYKEALTDAELQSLTTI